MIKDVYTRAIDHMGKLLSAAGAGLVSIDLAGVAEPAKAFARDALGPQGVKIVALALFVALLIRTWYIGRKAARLAEQVKQQ